MRIRVVKEFIANWGVIGPERISVGTILENLDKSLAKSLILQGVAEEIVPEKAAKPAVESKVAPVAPPLNKMISPQYKQKQK